MCLNVVNSILELLHFVEKLVQLPACGGHGPRSPVPQRASPAETLTGPGDSAKVSTQGGRRPPCLYTSSRPGFCRKMGGSTQGV